MMEWTKFGALACTVALFSATAFSATAAFADDPNDPAMRNKAARDADHAMIRKLNEDQLAAVRQRDAGYARGWRDYGAAHAAPLRSDVPATEDRAAYGNTLSSYQADQQAYAEQRRLYEQDMADWRARSEACRAGYYDACR